MNNNTPPLLLYDGECPFCNSFAQYYILRTNIPNLKIVSMRDEQVMKGIDLPAGIDLDKGMVLILDDKTVLQGEESLLYVTKAMQRKSVLERFGVYVLGFAFIRSPVYEVVKILRKVILRIKGVSRLGS